MEDSLSRLAKEYVSSVPTHLERRSECLRIINPPPGVLKALRMKRRTMEQEEKEDGTLGQKKIVEVNEDVFTPLRETHPVVIVTHQGFYRSMRALCQHAGARKVTEVDEREHVPPPDFSAMGGFRFSQRGLLEAALRQDESGCISAPTRYGKTTLIANTIRAYRGLRTVVALPGVDLCFQMHEDLVRLLPDREVKLICSGSKVRYQSDDVTVCSMDSLDKVDHGATKLLIVDEPHAAVTQSRVEMIASFTSARRLAFGASLKGRFDRMDFLIEGLFGPVLAERTFRDAVAEGAVCMITVGLIPLVTPRMRLWNRDLAMRKVFHNGAELKRAMDKLLNDFIPADFQTLIFIDNESQAEFLAQNVPSSIAMAKRLTKKERMDLMDRMRRNEVKRCFASRIYAQGVTFSDVRVVINAAGGGASTSSIQKPGRLAEIRPYKRRGILFDFMVTPHEDNPQGSGHFSLMNESLARLKSYQNTGYETYTTATEQHVRAVLDQA